jgi:hypothetical protein
MNEDEKFDLVAKQLRIADRNRRISRRLEERRHRRAQRNAFGVIAFITLASAVGLLITLLFAGGSP